MGDLTNYSGKMEVIMKRVFIFIWFIIGSNLMGLQTYPTVDWSIAGDNSTFVANTTITVNSVNDFFAALNSRDTSEITRIKLDPGIYNFGNNIINIDKNLIISGDSPETTTLLFNVGENAAINIQGSTDITKFVDHTHPECIEFGSDTLYLDDVNGINTGDYFLFTTDNTGSWEHNTTQSVV
ncbi:hypothetical protein [Fidelibacter multiformis]|jgi:hypothetical protein|uniref:hypothetical protein n=1 Tax=Fidelibacter multiformis TaxID=3377529 RepID=UPI0037DC343C